MVRIPEEIRIPEWHHLRPIGNSTLVRLSVLFPVAGYLILLNGQIAELLRLDPQFVLFPALESWRLVLIYYGLALLGLGSLLYTSACPSAVKRFGDSTSYMTEHFDFFASRFQFEPKIASVRRNLDAASNWQRSHFHIRHMVKTVEETEINRADKDMCDSLLKSALALQWHLYTTSRLHARTACVLAYGIGFAILSIPTLLTFLEVTAWIFGRTKLLSP